MSHPSGITDHCVLRFLERFYHLDIEAVRDEIASLPGLTAARKMGATSFSSQGITFRLGPEGVVTTVMGEDTPASGRMASAMAHGRAVAVREPSRKESARLLRRDARRFR